MVEKTLVVAVEPGLQAGPASEFVQKANSFSSEIFLEKGNRRVNAKSIMGLLSLAVTSGQTITLIGDGDDDQEAIDTLANFLSE
ncbi:catabolite repression HPr-like protein [Natronobacillus azotifigens]|uniref:HPr family phosphocarrier protein n=1 Tax=Natronobacillus azotifigens TaxID=472978 RepID=A0A9J6RDP9_9BACI|nr:HPr family phosphocarrier protein [Natronobacillus azotifigens]MCZ0703321.1 HPr family phosphocarrier protein [Natronobacillus azotifigens]